VALGVATVAKDDDTGAYCTYSSVKLDSALVWRAKTAAAKAQKPIQEWLSDLVNEATARELREKPIHRLPPRPRKR
jgi:hypothetical protein